MNVSFMRVFENAPSICMHMNVGTLNVCQHLDAVGFLSVCRFVRMEMLVRMHNQRPVQYMCQDKETHQCGFRRKGFAVTSYFFRAPSFNFLVQLVPRLLGVIFPVFWIPVGIHLQDGLVH